MPIQQRVGEVATKWCRLCVGFFSGLSGRARISAVMGFAFAMVAGGPAEHAFADAEYKFTFSSPYPDSLFHVQNVREFISDVHEASQGRIEITLYTNQTLFNHSESMHAVRSGQVDFAELQLTQFANQEELYNFESIPFLATGYESATKLMEAAKPFVVARLARDRIRQLYSVPWPPQAFYANKELVRLEDMRGLKFRVYNPMSARMGELLGVSPVLVGGGEVPQAFATGMIDSMVTSSAFGASASAWDYVTYFHDTEAWLGFNQIVMNTRSFDRLPEDLQSVVLEAAQAAELRGLEMSVKANEEQKAVLVSNGVTIISPSQEFLDAASEATKSILDDWIKAVGVDGKTIVDTFRSTQ